MAEKHWTEREHSAYVRTRFYSCGWEFDTAQDARGYVGEQFKKYPRRDMENTPFQFHVASGGVEVRGMVSANLGTIVFSTTYAKGETMRDRTRVVSPTDCVWLVPGHEE